MNKKLHLGIASFIYAIFYSFCLYRNMGGATFPFFVVGTLCYIYYCIKGFEITFKKNSLFLCICCLLIGLSQALTSDSVIQSLNVFVVYSLFVCLLLHQFFDDTRWNIGIYMKNLICTIGGTLTCIFKPFTDFSAYQKEKRAIDGKPAFPIITVLLSIAFAIPFLIIIMTLLGSADVYFAKLIDGLFYEDMFTGHIFPILILTVVVFMVSYGLISYLLKHKLNENPTDNRTGDPVIAITITSLLSVIYIVFAFIQIFGLFLGTFRLPEGYTYAGYAREGFFQLLAVCIINLLLITIGNQRFRENRILKCILTVICGCTYIMVASSAFRMIMYIRYFYFTFLRIFVLWALFLILLLLTGLLISIWKHEFKLFRYSLMVAAGCYLVLSFSHPDYFIAKWNTQRAYSSSDFYLCKGTYDDYEYLDELSNDAAPVLLRDKNYMAYNSQYQEDLRSISYDIRTFNFSNYYANYLARR